MQQQNILQQKKCQPHGNETVAYNLDPLAELKYRYLCLDCLTTPQPYRQLKKIQDAQQIFIKMSISDFQKKKELIQQNIAKLVEVRNQITQSFEFLANKIALSIKILSTRIVEEQNKLATLFQPSYEMQYEQDLINLSNYVNYGFNNNLNRANSNNFEFIEQIQQLLDYQIFYEELEVINNSLEAIQTQSLYQQQVNFISYNEQYGFENKLRNLRYLCQSHNKNFEKISLKPGQYEQRLFCEECIPQQGLDKLYNIYDVNNKWQTHILEKQNIYNKFFQRRKNDQQELKQLLVSCQKFNQHYMQTAHKLRIQNANKIKDRNGSQSSLLNIQIYQMKLQEIEEVAKVLSQHDSIQEDLYRQFQKQYRDDKQDKIQILEQLNLSRKMLFSTSQEIDKLFYPSDLMESLNNNFIESQFLDKIIPEFQTKFQQFLFQYQLIKYRFQQLKILNQNQQINRNQSLQYQKFQLFFEQIQQIERILPKQIQLSPHNLQIELKFQLKRSQNNLSIKNLHIKQNYCIKRSLNNLSTQNIHIQQKQQIRFNKSMSINTIYDYQQISFNQWFSHRKNLKFSNELKHSSINIIANGKIATTKINNKIYAPCICDFPITQNVFFTIDLKINKLTQIMIGICSSKILNQDYNNYNYNQIGHGIYGLYYSGFVLSHHDSLKNGKDFGFKLHQGDIITVQVNQETKQIIWNNKVKGLSCALEFQPFEDLYFFCALYSYNNKISEVEIV